MNETVKDMPFHFERSVVLNTPAADVFSYLDNPRRLLAHMSQSSWMMAGARMNIELDAVQGRAPGSKIHLSGHVLGIPLALDEAVTGYSPPLHKSWSTTSESRLLVIGHYKMGFDITQQGSTTQLRILIDYALPEFFPARWLGKMFGRFYARWCVRRMISDAERHFV